MHKPYMLNSLYEQKWLLDRRVMYDALKSNDIRTPRHEYMNRDGYGDGNMSTLEEFEDYIIVNGERFNKPFVGKSCCTNRCYYQHDS